MLHASDICVLSPREQNLKTHWCLWPYHELVIYSIKAGIILVSQLIPLQGGEWSWKNCCPLFSRCYTREEMYIFGPCRNISWTLIVFFGSDSCLSIRSFSINFKKICDMSQKLGIMVWLFNMQSVSVTYVNISYID